MKNAPRPPVRSLRRAEKKHNRRHGRTRCVRLAIHGEGAGMGIKIESTEFEVVLADLAGLTRGQLVERVLERATPKDVAAFVSTANGLTVETLRLLSATT